MNHDCKEMIKLRAMLEESEVPYADASDVVSGYICPGYMTVDRIEIYKPKTMYKLVTVAHGYGSMGGFRKTDKSDDEGLLEINVHGQRRTGYKVAEDVYRLIVELRDSI